jgi:multidrug efflux pump
MGGMITATALAVFFVPVFYVVVMRVFGRRAPAPKVAVADKGVTDAGDVT